MKFPVLGARINPNSAVGKEVAAQARRAAEKARAEQARLAAEQKRYLEELDAEIAREDREAAEPRPQRDPVEELRAQLDTESRLRQMVERGEYPRHPPGFAIKEQDKRRRRAEREQRERQEREAKLGIPEAAREWDARAEEINTARNQAISEAQERCRTEEEAARARAEDELSELGSRPSLSDYEVTA
ncbi:MAG TPA: hypothetical protein VMI13_01040 [Solirubrobacteraceae bacterium]|nr:hypothetical protein [Solirubrobacteraceae bacterium]